MYVYVRGVDTNHHWAGDDGADYNLSMADRHTRRIKLHVRLIHIHIHNTYVYSTILYAFIVYMSRIPRRK